MGQSGPQCGGGGVTQPRGGTVTHLPGAALMQGHALVPLVHVVRVLAQQDAVEQQGPAADELLEAGQPQLQVHVIWAPWWGSGSTSEGLGTQPPHSPDPTARPGLADSAHWPPSRRRIRHPGYSPRVPRAPATRPASLPPSLPAPDGPGAAPLPCPSRSGPSGPLGQPARAFPPCLPRMTAQQLTVLLPPQFRGCLHLGCDHALFELCVAVKHLREVAHGHHGPDGLLIHISGLRAREDGRKVLAGEAQVPTHVNTGRPTARPWQWSRAGIALLCQALSGDGTAMMSCPLPPGPPECSGAPTPPQEADGDAPLCKVNDAQGKRV